MSDEKMANAVYRVTWEAAFNEFVAAVEEYISVELPSDASPAERKLQRDLAHHIANYKQAKIAEEEKKRAKT